MAGKDGLQYLYHPIAYGPFLADKYGYPSISKLHQQDPISTKKNFWGRQGILRVITYTKHNSNLPKGHVALWDCNHFHQSKDWIAGHTLITVEFWESPGECNANDITCYIFFFLIYLEYWLQKESDYSKKYRKWSIHMYDICIKHSPQNKGPSQCHISQWMTFKFYLYKMCSWNTNAPGGNKSKLTFFSKKVTIKVTRSLTLVSFEKVSLFEYACSTSYG